MRKLVIILGILIGFVCTLDAQSYTLYNRGEQTYYTSTEDVTITDEVAVELWIKSNTKWPTTQHILIDCDSVSGNHTAMVMTLFGRNFDDAAWVSLASSANVDQGVDSKIDITSTSTTETRWTQFKIVLTGTGTGVSKVNKLDFKLFYPD